LNDKGFLAGRLGAVRQDAPPAGDGLSRGASPGGRPWVAGKTRPPAHALPWSCRNAPILDIEPSGAGAGL